jgi:hypothetical protein
MGGEDEGPGSNCEPMALLYKHIADAAQVMEALEQLVLVFNFDLNAT